ncbi:hypothetical protein JB92DRAFT_2830143 [Gautieria morchelliformis]|nr:hypothetical protein JB92DRAFT_2830143 [Gautieria morchelliformis]
MIVVAPLCNTRAEYIWNKWVDLRAVIPSALLDAGTRFTVKNHKHKHTIAWLNYLGVALMRFSKDLHQVEEIRLQDAAILEDVQKLFLLCEDPKAPCWSSHPLTASECGHAAEYKQREEQHRWRMLLLTTPVEQDMQFRNESHMELVAPMGNHKTIQQIVREQVISEPDSETTAESLELEAMHWQQKEAIRAT